MRRRKRRKIKFFNIIFSILFLYFIISMLNMYRYNSDYINNFKNETETKLNTETKEKIIQYMDEYYKSMTTLKEVDMTYLFSKDAKEEAYINQTAISTLVNIRKLEKNDMRIRKAKYDIFIKEIDISENEINITFLENDYLNFNFMKNTQSKVFDIENVITFNNSNEIIKFRKTQDFYVMITNKYEPGKNLSDAKKELDNIKNNHIKDYKNQLKILDSYKKDFKEGVNKPSKTCDNKYNRNNALEYANKYVIKKNNKWFDYATIGGNCQNYSSQVLFAGNIPMDVIGDSVKQWKNYSEELDETNNKSGRSSSWTSVQSFYEYAKYNEGFGLCAEVDINPFYAEIGDIGQVGYDEEYRHSVVIIGKIKDFKGDVKDLLINSNSVNLVNYPLSGYVYPYKRVIKIFGYNDF